MAGDFNQSIPISNLTAFARADGEIATKLSNVTEPIHHTGKSYRTRLKIEEPRIRDQVRRS
jgi:hypothetical protein